MRKFAAYLRQLIDDGESFVAWRLPYKNEVYLLHGFSWKEGLPNDLSGYDGFLFHPFITTVNSPILHITGDILPLSNLDFGEGPDEEMVFSNETISNGEAYISLVMSAQTAIENGQIEKVVLADKQETASEIMPHQFFDALLSKHTSALCTITNIPEKGTWVGATPEVLLNWQNDIAETVALAGTKHTSSANDWQHKEIDEQSIVLKHIVEVLKGQGVKDLTVSEPQNMEYGKLSHRINSIRWHEEFTMDTLIEKLKALHPTPAVAGFPVKEAIDFILKKEGFERGYYAGYLGPISEKGASIFVNIRQVHFYKGTIASTAGAGITAGSDAQKEWQEIQQKRASLLQ